METNLRIDNLRAGLLEDEWNRDLTLTVQELDVVLNRAGLQRVVNYLVPEEPLRVDLQPRTGGGRLTVRATRWGFNATLYVDLGLDDSNQGAVAVSLLPASRWSPLDQAVLNVAASNLNRQSRERPEIARRENRRYSVDLQLLIRSRLLDSGAPLRWDARLSRVAVEGDEIHFQFSMGISPGRSE